MEENKVIEYGNTRIEVNEELKESLENFEVRRHKNEFYIGLVGTVGMLFFILFFIIVSERIDSFVMFGVSFFFFIMLLSIFIIVRYKRWAIKISGNELDCQFVFKHKKLTFDDIDLAKINERHHIIAVYSKGKKVFLVRGLDPRLYQRNLSPGYLDLVFRVKLEGINTIIM